MTTILDDCSPLRIMILDDEQSSRITILEDDSRRAFGDLNKTRIDEQKPCFLPRALPQGLPRPQKNR